jgi:LAO/AO transport system kinase
MANKLFQNLLENVRSGSALALARSISLVENQVEGYEHFMENLPVVNVPVIGITGPPGAGKSTLVDGLVGKLVAGHFKVGILCVDPSSPFNLGALLGDRIRMSNWYNHPQVFIRSLASRGSVGGLHPYIIEITDIMKAAGFDYVIVETVGVGQSEIEIAGLADVTVVTLVPEAGDEIQTMKAGLMEIADVFVVNKADRPNADEFARNLRMIQGTGLHNSRQAPVLKTVASHQQGIDELVSAILDHLKRVVSTDRKFWLMAERAYYLIQKQKMAGISKAGLKTAIALECNNQEFNLYRFVHEYLVR